MKQKKILIVTTGLVKTTGYATVAWNIYKLIKEKFEVGFFYTMSDERPIKDVKTYFPKQKKELGSTFIKALQDFNPDLVLTIGDIWNLNFVSEIKKSISFRWLAYVAVEAEYFPKRIRTTEGTYIDIQEIMAYVDSIVSYSKFGQKELEKAGYFVDDYIYHGVDTNIFKPITQNKKELKKRLFDKDDNPFMFLCVADNQPRKRIDSLLQAWAELSDDNKFKHGEFLVLITQPIKAGGLDIPDLLKRYNIEDSVVINLDYIHSRGVSQKELVDIYNLADCFVLPSAAEGFGLPYLEALACGTPVIYTDYATPKEILNNKIGFGLEPAYFYPIWDLGYHFAQIDIEDLKDRIKAKLNIDYKQCVSHAKKFEWKTFKGQWVNAINKGIKKTSKTGVLI